MEMERESTFCLLLVVSFTINVYCDTSCKPRPVLLESTEYGADYEPHFFELHRCKGRDDGANSAMACVATKKEKIVQIARNRYNEIEKESAFENHTDCKMGCVCGDCTRATKYEATCDEGFIWDENICTCKPKCRSGMRRNTNERYDENTIPLSMFVVALTIEFFIVIIIVLLALDMCKCSKHSKGVIYKTAKYVKSVSTSGEKLTAPNKKIERNGTGSVSFLHDVQVDQSTILTA